jgi:hypothetical protein
MAISYPLSLPTVIGIRSIELRAVNAVAYSQSPFTFAGQAHAYQGQMWQADITLPPMNAARAEQWVAFLLSLRGQYGTFLLGDPLRTSLRGTATSCSITGSSGDNTVSATVPNGETLLAGDYIQLGSASTTTIHKVLVDYTGTGAAADLEIWPAIRTDHTASSATLSNAKGKFRLSSNEQAWSINEASIYGITFGAMEAI